MHWDLWKSVVFGLLICVSGLGVLGAPLDLDTFTTFSGSSGVGVPFDVGVAPDRATFSGDAFKGTLGVAELYKSGLTAWMVNPGGVGVVDFETPAGVVEFYARTRSNANGATVITALGANDVVIDTFNLDVASLGAPFDLVSFSGVIHKLEIVNHATVFGQMNSIDNFGYSSVVVVPIPEPGVGGLVLVVAGGLVMRRRARRKGH